MIKFPHLEDLARDLVGDGRRPNLFFVSVKGTIVTVTTDSWIAYQAWRAVLAEKQQETALEDRLHGVVSSSEWDPNAKRFVVYDESLRLLKDR